MLGNGYRKNLPMTFSFLIYERILILKIMIYLKGIYDSGSKKMIIEFKNGLLENYFDVLENCVKESKSRGILPDDLEVQNLEDSRCLITFHIDLPEAQGMKDGQRIGTLPKDMTNKISGVIEDFRKKAIKEEFTTTEFIPLAGYPLEELQKDIHEAIKNKRNFCVVDNYAEYLKFADGKTTSLNQSKVRYLSNEYSDTAIYIYEGNLKKLRELYKDKLSVVDWG